MKTRRREETESGARFEVKARFVIDNKARSYIKNAWSSKTRRSKEIIRLMNARRSEVKIGLRWVVTLKESRVVIVKIFRANLICEPCNSSKL